MKIIKRLEFGLPYAITGTIHCNNGEKNCFNMEGRYIKHFLKKFYFSCSEGTVYITDNDNNEIIPIKRFRLKEKDFLSIITHKLHLSKIYSPEMGNLSFVLTDVEEPYVIPMGLFKDLFSIDFSNSAEVRDTAYLFNYLYTRIVVDQMESRYVNDSVMILDQYESSPEDIQTLDEIRALFKNNPEKVSGEMIKDALKLL